MHTDIQNDKHLVTHFMLKDVAFFKYKTSTGTGQQNVYIGLSKTGRHFIREKPNS